MQGCDRFVECNRFCLRLDQIAGKFSRFDQETHRVIDQLPVLGKQSPPDSAACVAVGAWQRRRWRWRWITSAGWWRRGRTCHTAAATAADCCSQRNRRRNETCLSQNEGWNRFAHDRSPPAVHSQSGLLGVDETVQLAENPSCTYPELLLSLLPQGLAWAKRGGKPQGAGFSCSKIDWKPASTVSQSFQYRVAFTEFSCVLTTAPVRSRPGGILEIKAQGARGTPRACSDSTQRPNRNRRRSGARAGRPPRPAAGRCPRRAGRWLH